MENRKLYNVPQARDTLTLHGHTVIITRVYKVKVEKVAGTNDDAQCGGNDPTETQKPRRMSLYGINKASHIIRTDNV